MFGLSGIFGHPPSTVMGVVSLGISVAGIFFPAIPAAVQGAAAVAGALGVLYKGKPE